MIRAVAMVLAVMLASCNAAAQSTPDLVPRLQELASAGNAEASYYLGMSYHLGIGVTKDQAKALSLFKRGTELGDPLAAYKLGCFYDSQGEGVVEPDAEAALANKLIAAKAGHALAQQDAAALYATKGDMKNSIMWLERAVAQGWPDSLYTYAFLQRGYPGVSPDRVKAVAYLRLYLARRDDADARAALTADQAKLSRDEEARAAAIVADYRPTPTALTIKALSGQRAAEAFVKSTR